MGNLTRLTNLNLIKTGLKELPENIGDLIRLKNLALSAYTMSNLPRSFLHLTNLEHLIIDYNRDMNITDSIAIRNDDNRLMPIDYYLHLPNHFTKLSSQNKDNIRTINQEIDEYNTHVLATIAHSIKSRRNPRRGNSPPLASLKKRRGNSLPLASRKKSAKRLTSNSAPARMRRSYVKEIPNDLIKHIASYHSRPRLKP
jgi:hypothetical protein